MSYHAMLTIVCRSKYKRQGEQFLNKCSHETSPWLYPICSWTYTGLSCITYTSFIGKFCSLILASLKFVSRYLISNVQSSGNGLVLSDTKPLLMIVDQQLRGRLLSLGYNELMKKFTKFLLFICVRNCLKKLTSRPHWKLLKTESGKMIQSNCHAESLPSLQVFIVHIFRV